MTRTTRYAAFVFVTAMTGALLVAGSLRAGNAPQEATHDARIDIAAMMATTDMATLPLHHIENPL